MTNISNINSNSFFPIMDQGESNKKLKSRALTQFLETTTVHGLGRVFNSESKLKKMIWFLLITGGICYVSYAILDSVQKYYSYPVTTKVKVVFEKEAPFPAVTVCNRNKYSKKRALEKYPTLASYYLKTGAKRRDVNISSEEMETIFYDIGHPVKETLISCRWASNYCNKKSVVTNITESYGQCFTFNPGEPHYPLVKVHSSGRFFGLTLRLYVNYENYLNAGSVGMYVFIHDQNEPINVGQMGIAVSPGTSTQIGLRRIQMSNLQKPYEGACEDLKIPGYKKYTKSACMQNCFYNYILKRCGCKKEGFYGPARMCSFQERVGCVIKAQKYFRLRIAKQCFCPVPCKMQIYETSIAQFSWPGPYYIKLWEKKWRRPNMTDQQYEAFLRENFVEILIYLKSMKYELIEQVPAYTSIDLFGSVGGLVGLFLGASLLTVFEFFDLFWDLCSPKKTHNQLMSP